jgi:hypothetical protein
MPKENSMLNRIGKQREIYGLLFIAVILFSTFFVFTLPVPIEDMVQKAYNVVQSYGKGGPNYGNPMIVMHAESYTDVLPLGTAIEAFWNHVGAINASVIVFTAHVETGQTQRALFELKREYGQDFPNVPQYGHSVVFLGYCISQTMPPVWNNIWDAFGNKDYFGNNLADLPIMQSNPNHSLSDFDTVVSLSPWAGTNWIEIHSFGVQNLLDWSNENQKGDLVKFMATGWLQGGVAGPRYGLMYERLTGIPGSNSLLSTTSVLGGVYVIVGIVVANLWVWANRRRKNE